MSNVSGDSPLTAEQCRAARALLGWSQSEPETESGVARKTLADFENGHRTPYERTLLDIRTALEEAGVKFIAENGEGAGVRLRRVVWLLTPIDLDDPNWAASVRKGPAIIRASTERRARMIASGAFGIAVARKHGEQTAVNPWSGPARCVTCERLEGDEYDQDGPEGVLDPEEYEIDRQQRGG